MESTITVDGLTEYATNFELVGINVVWPLDPNVQWRVLLKTDPKSSFTLSMTISDAYGLQVRDCACE